MVVLNRCKNGVLYTKDMPWCYFSVQKNTVIPASLDSRHVSEQQWKEGAVSRKQ